VGTREPKVDVYIAKAQPFAQDILAHLRDVVHGACPEIEEAMKWSMPFFTYKGSLLCNMAAFKAHCAFGFWLGEQVLGTDASGEAMGQLGRITSVKGLPTRTQLTQWVHHAMALTDAGVKNTRDTGAAKTPAKKAAAKTVAVPVELAKALQRDAKAKAVFDAFSPSHRREYVEWIADAKKPETKERRIAQALEMLANGQSRNAKYESPKRKG
jgi:uncharacterized protein YdeI (YjbR/CyaY-like superfamily)